MDKELSGFVACMQELELACDEISKASGIQGQEFLAQLKSSALFFLGSPSHEAAQDIMDLIKRMKLKCHAEGKGPTIFNHPIHIDSQTTSLDKLGEELLELLEDSGK